MLAGANPNGISVDLTPLSYAASESDEQMIKCLLEAGADPNMLDSELEQILDQGKTLPPPIAILMNGQQQLNFTVEKAMFDSLDIYVGQTWWDPKANAARPNPQDTPLKLADNLSIDGVFSIGFPQNVSSERSLKQGTYVLEASLHEFIEVVFINNEDTLQTWHLDGYDFFVVGMGQGKWTPASKNGKDAYNLVDAFTRHTVQVYPKCWTAIYVSLDNQGMWNLRSAMWERQYLGQQFYLKVFGEISPDNEYIPTLKETILCGKAKHYGTSN
ncbi:hypothetical protein OROHE_026245 [Orobanche hederae]